MPKAIPNSKDTRQRGSQALHWCFTLNNYVANDLRRINVFKSQCVYLVFGKEVGANNTPHLQGYFCLLKRQRLTALKKSFSSTAHLEIARGLPSQAADYCKKDGDFVEYGKQPDDPTAKGNKQRKANRDEVYSDAFKQDSREAALRLIKEKASRDYALNLERLEYAINKEFVVPFPPYEPIFKNPLPLDTPLMVKDWIEHIGESRTPMLILLGETKLGKTHWARTMFPVHTYFKGMVNLKNFNPASTVLIFDDFDWKYLPSPKNWLTQAGDAEFTDKWVRKKTLRISMPAIYICNELPDWTPPEKRYWEANSIIVEVTKPMYKDKPIPLQLKPFDVSSKEESSEEFFSEELLDVSAEEVSMDYEDEPQCRGCGIFPCECEPFVTHSKDPSEDSSDESFEIILPKGTKKIDDIFVPLLN